VSVHVTPFAGDLGILHIGDPNLSRQRLVSGTLSIPVAAGQYDVLIEMTHTSVGYLLAGLALKRFGANVGPLDDLAIGRLTSVSGTAWAFDTNRMPSDRDHAAWHKVAAKASAYPWPINYRSVAPLGRRGIFMPTGTGPGTYDVFVARENNVISYVLLDFTWSDGNAFLVPRS
jgi:hypothetical protein